MRGSYNAVTKAIAVGPMAANPYVMLALKEHNEQIKDSVSKEMSRRMLYAFSIMPRGLEDREVTVQAGFR